MQSSGGAKRIRRRRHPPAHDFGRPRQIRPFGPQRPLRDSDSDTAVTLAPCGRMDTVCLFPCVVSDRLAEKLSPRAAASMWSPPARPEIVPEALRLDSLHEPEIAPPR